MPGTAAEYQAQLDGEARSLRERFTAACEGERWAGFSEDEIKQLLDGLDAWDFETASYTHSPNGLAAKLRDELCEVAKARGMMQVLVDQELIEPAK